MEHNDNITSRPKMRYSFMNLLTGSDLSKRRLPMMEIRAAQPGPVIWLTACAHGDEVGGVAVVHEMFRLLQKIKFLKGAVHSFPMLNPIGFEMATRSIPFSKEDLNRSFPGNRKGSMAERIADHIFRTITATKPDLVLDLHNDWVQSIPYVVLDPNPGEEFQRAYKLSEEAAVATGLAIVREEADGAEAMNWTATLSGSMIAADIPAVTLELGAAHIVNETNVLYGVGTLLNVMTHLGMIEPPKGLFNYPLPAQVKGRFLKYSQHPLTSTSGIVRFAVAPGDMVKQGKPVAWVYNVFGKKLETLKAAQEGIVLGHSDSSTGFPGVPVVAYGLVVNE